MCHSWAGYILLRLFSGLNAWIVVFDFEHEYLEAVDLTSYVGTIPTGLASDILA